MQNGTLSSNSTGFLTEVQRCFLEFLKSFRTKDCKGGAGSEYYTEQMRQVLQTAKRKLSVKWDHLAELDPSSVSFRPADLQRAIRTRFLSVQGSLNAAAYCLMREVQETESHCSINDNKDIVVSFFGLPAEYEMQVLRSEGVGRLSVMKGSIIKTSEVQPELVVGSFRCGSCAKEVSSASESFRVRTPARCSSCEKQANWTLLEASPLTKWGDWQELQVQPRIGSNSSRITSRPVSVIIRNEDCGHWACGDFVDLTGCIAALPEVSSLTPIANLKKKLQQPAARHQEGEIGTSGERFMRNSHAVVTAGHKLFFLASFICKASATETRENVKRARAKNNHSQSQLEPPSQPLPSVSQPRLRVNSLERLAKAIAPSVHGHVEVKKGILLMLLGGVHKDLPGGCINRGSIHVCLFGEPATAKSTLLRWVASFLPRGVYTSGAGCSAAGLTAAVVSDDSGEKVLKAGALMQASGSVCCIDDFEMMQDRDQISIKEVMDQQAISISKAGIQARLNASSSVLIACSTRGSGYNRFRTVHNNLAEVLPATMLPCFDLLFTVQDDCSGTTDEDVAHHMIALACSGRAALESRELGGRQGPGMSAGELWQYVQHARTIQPEITREAHCRLTNCYTELRSKSQGLVNRAGGANARHLESLIRLSEACARAHLDTHVQVEHVDAAFELMHLSWTCNESSLPVAGAPRIGDERPLKRARFRGA